MKKKINKTKILKEMLMANEVVDNQSMVNACKMYRLSGHIKALKKQRWNILTKMHKNEETGTRWGTYHLVSVPF